VLADGKNQGMLGEHTLEIDPDGLTERTTVNVQRYSWSGIERIEETADFALFFTSAISAHVVPKRRVVVGDTVRFLGLAKQYWLSATPAKQAANR